MNAADVASQLDSLRQIAAEAQELADLRFHCIQEQAAEISRLAAALAAREARLRECVVALKQAPRWVGADLLQRIEAELGEKNAERR